MTINFNNKTIELTKTEMTNASKYGSQMYRDLMDARHDNPDFRIVEVKVKKSKSDFSDLTMATIKSYVEAHGSIEQKKNFEFISKKTIDENGEYHEPQSFFDIKKWFLDEFPEIKQRRKDYREKVQEIYEAAAAKAEAAKKAAETKKTNNPKILPLAQ